MAASKSPKKGKSKKTKQAGAETKKLSALDAAAKVLAETGQPMSCKELIEAMAAKGYWSSPGGKTPALRNYQGDIDQGQGIPLSENQPGPLRPNLRLSQKRLPHSGDNVFPAAASFRS